MMGGAGAGIELRLGTLIPQRLWLNGAVLYRQIYRQAKILPILTEHRRVMDATIALQPRLRHQFSRGTSSAAA